MYVPRPNAVEDPLVMLDLVRAAGVGHLVSHVDGILDSTMLPLLVDDGLTSVRAHFARVNHQWRSLDGARVLVVVPVSDAYISPAWYPSKRDDPAVVPTWNYEVVHLHGVARVRDDAEFVERVVRELTELHEAARTTRGGPPTWEVDDAPADFIARKLRAIVGIEIDVDRIAAKRKLSQNRDVTDQRGVVSGLDSSERGGDVAVANAMRALDRDDSGDTSH